MDTWLVLDPKSGDGRRFEDGFGSLTAIYCSARSRGRAVSRTAKRFEELVADGTADDESVVRVAPARRGVDDPVRSMHEAQVLPQVVAELSEAAEGYEMPETAATPALEQSVAHHALDGTIRHSIVREL